MACKNVCTQIYHPKTLRPNAWYTNGRKRCIRCQFSTVTEDNRCKCCGKLFRLSPRPSGVNSKLKPVPRVS